MASSVAVPKNSLVLDSYAVSEVFAVDAAGGLIGTGTGRRVLRAYAMSTIATLNGPAGGLISDGAGFSGHRLVLMGRSFAYARDASVHRSVRRSSELRRLAIHERLEKCSLELGRPVLAWE